LKDLRYRAATYEDLTSLLKLEQNIIDSERPYDPFIRNEDVTYSDGEVVGSGYAQIRPSKSCHNHERHCYLGFIYLEPEQRGKALGRGIIETLKEWGISQGTQHFHLDVYSENESAIRAYEKAGFKKVSVKMELVV